tara:strand:- start:300 stop:497 length:198 start_codon:yes stop_codon:yes gene_type:complete
MAGMYTVKWKLSGTFTNEIVAESEEDAEQIWWKSTHRFEALDELKEIDFDVVTVVRHSLEEKTSV